MENDRVFVAGLPFTWTNLELTQHAAKFGAVRFANVLVHDADGRSRGCGFINCETPRDAKCIVAGLHGMEVAFRRIQAELARPRDNSPRAT